MGAPIQSPKVPADLGASAAPPTPAAPPSMPPSANKLAGKGAIPETSPEALAKAAQMESDAILQFIQGFAMQYPQAGQAAKQAIAAVKAMGEAVLATIEPPMATGIEPPPGV